MYTTRYSLRGSRGAHWLITDACAIGRDLQCAVVLRDPRVSRRHAKLTPAADGLIVQDNESANGTFVNDRRIGVPTPLHTGDRLRIGHEVLVVEAAKMQASDSANADMVGFVATAQAPRSVRSRRPRVMAPALAVLALATAVVAGVIVITATQDQTPDIAARNWMHALGSQDVSRLSGLTCLAQQNSVQATSLVVGAGGLFGSSLDVDGLEYQTSRRDAITADVQVSGPVRISLGPLSTARRLSLNVKMKYESGQWRYCDDLQRLASQL